MAIEVNKVFKYYGSQAALNDVSFSISDNEIVGFLGPNGAGKSTMMKILTGYIPPDSGKASINGISVEEDSKALRRQVGYLPEHNPLYHDLYVKEFLTFVAELYKIGKAGARIREVIHMTGLEPEQNKRIGALSKGYRQRVGLAQAILHDPKVLILDEPTTGLDPNQIEDIRLLIRDLGREKTVMLSTHIMQEVEAICDRVIIIDKGHLVADDKAENLKQNQNIQVVRAEFSSLPLASQLKLLPEGIQASQVDHNTYRFSSGGDSDLRKLIFDWAVANHLSVLSLNREEQRMEEVFRRYTRGT